MLRDQYDIDDKDIELFTHTDKDGSVYLCLKVFDQGHPEVRSAIDVLRAYGCDVPSVLLDALLTEEDDDEEETADE